VLKFIAKITAIQRRQQISAMPTQSVVHCIPRHRKPSQLQSLLIDRSPHILGSVLIGKLGKRAALDSTTQILLTSGHRILSAALICAVSLLCVVKYQNSCGMLTACKVSLLLLASINKLGDREDQWGFDMFSYSRGFKSSRVCRSLVHFEPNQEKTRWKGSLYVSN